MTQVIAPLLAWRRVLREDVAPVLSGYLVFVGTALVYANGARGRARRFSVTGPETRPTVADFVRYLATMLVTGYLVFLAIVVVFYFVLGNQRRSFLADALTRGSLLTFGIVLPGFVLLTLAEAGVRRVRRSRSRSRP